MVYLYLYGLALLGSFFEVFKSRELKKITAIFLVLSIIFVIAFRYASTDYFGYFRIFEGVEGNFDNFGFLYTT